MASGHLHMSMEMNITTKTEQNLGTLSNGTSLSQPALSTPTSTPLIPASQIKISPDSRSKNMMDQYNMQSDLVSSINTTGSMSPSSLGDDLSNIDEASEPTPMTENCDMTSGTSQLVQDDSVSPSLETPTTSTSHGSPSQTPNPEKPKQKRIELSLREKVSLLKEAETHKSSQRALAKMFGIGKTQVGLVLKRKMEILTAYKFTNESKQRKRSRFMCNEDIENGTWEWYQQTRAQGKAVTGTMLREKCLEIAARIGKTQFKASNGWLEGFKHRHNITFGAPPLEDRLKRWLSLLPELTLGYLSKDVFVMHEFRLYFRALPQKNALVHSTSGQGINQIILNQDQLTVLICANQEGELLQPIVIGHEEKPQAFQDIDLNELPVVWQYNVNRGLMNGVMYRKWLEDFNRTMKEQDRRVIMILDDSHAHPKDLTNMSNVEIAHLSATSVTDWNPLYHGVIQAVKVAYRRRFIEYILVKIQNGALAKDAAESVGVLEACQWIGAAATDITQTTIMKAFLKVNLGTSLTRDCIDPDNSQDAQTLMYLLHTARDWMFLDEPITDPEEYAAIDDHTLARDETPVPALPSPGMGRSKNNNPQSKSSETLSTVTSSVPSESTSVPPASSSQAPTAASASNPTKINNFQEAIDCVGKLKDFCMFNSLADVWGLLSCAEQVLQAKSSTPSPSSLMPAP